MWEEIAGSNEWASWAMYSGALRSQLRSPKLSRKPRRFVVSEGEKRSAEEGSGGGGGKRLGSDGSNELKSKSWNGAGGCSSGDAMARRALLRGTHPAQPY
jgi:hypothetical protein